MFAPLPELFILVSFSAVQLGVLSPPSSLIPWDHFPPALVIFLIFAFRTTDLTLATLRMLAVIRGHRSAAWLIGFAQATFFTLGVASAFSSLDRPLFLIAYACGYASGNVLGMTLESRHSRGHSLLRIVSMRRGLAISQALREGGYGVTEVNGQGRLGTVSLIYCYLPHREVERVKEQLLAIDPEAFISAQNIRELRGGWKA